MLINISQLNIDVRGIIHIGAFIGEEQVVYDKMDIKNVLYIEPLERHCNKLLERLGNVNLLKCALGNYNGEATINISSTEDDGRPWFNRGDGASSSILKPKKHLTQHPNIHFYDKELVPIYKLDTLVDQGVVALSLYNMINIDVQGYELEIFKGASATLNNIDYILTEVNKDEVYENCAQVEELDDFLSKYSFKRILTNWAGGIWGDAFYKKITQ